MKDNELKGVSWTAIDCPICKAKKSIAFPISADDDELTICCRAKFKDVRLMLKAEIQLAQWCFIGLVIIFGIAYILSLFD